MKIKPRVEKCDCLRGGRRGGCMYWVVVVGAERDPEWDSWEAAYAQAYKLATATSTMVS